MNRILAQYVQVVDFLGRALGKDYEIALHSFSDSKYSIIAIANGFNSGRQVGAPITGKALEFITDKVYERENYQINYTGRVGSRVTMRSSTMFIKDENGRLIGMLCINYNTARCREAVDKILEIFQMPSPFEGTVAQKSELQTHEETAEYFVGNIRDLISEELLRLVGDSSAPRERLTQEEKIEIVRSLNRKGVFLIKGTVSEVASQLCSSEASIYRYLSKINKEEAGRENSTAGG